MPADSDFAPLKGLPGTADEKLSGDGSVRWVRFFVECQVDLTLWLKFSGGAASQVLVDRVAAGTDRSLTEETRPQQDRSAVPAHDPNVDYPLQFTRGRHEVLLMLDGSTAAAIAVSVETPWRQIAAEKSWSALDRGDRLRTLADKFGPFAELHLQRRAHELLSALRDLQQRFTTTLVAADLPTPRETRVLSRGEYNLPIGDPLEPDVLAVMSPLPEGAPAIVWGWRSG